MPLPSLRETTNPTQDLVLLGGLVLVGYVLYKVFGAVSAAAGAASAGAKAVGATVKGGYTATVDALSSGLYSAFGPADVGTSVYYLVNFPDGTRHAVPSNTVDAQGNFTWTGFPPNSQDPLQLILVKDKSGAWFATSNTFIPLSPNQLQPVGVDPSIVADIPAVNYGPGQTSISGGRW
jgi:hypothetical protein